MKKILTLILAVIMVLLLVACGSKPTPDNQGEPTDTPQGGDKREISFTELVAVDNDDCLIKIIGINPDDFWGLTLKLLLENKSDDKTYAFSIESVSINGIQCGPIHLAEVAAGKKENKEIIPADNSLKENGIAEYTDIELTFCVRDDNDWAAGYVVRETVHVYPYGKDNAVTFVREAQPSDKIILDNEYVTVTVIGYEIDEIWGYSVNLFLQNKTDTNVIFRANDASVNGFMADPFYVESVSAGKCAFSSISWSNLKINDITEVEEIEFLLNANDSDNWMRDDFANELITLNP